MSSQNQNFNYILFERTALKLFLFGMRRGQIRVDSSQQQQQQQAWLPYAVQKLSKPMKQ